MKYALTERSIDKVLVGNRLTNRFMFNGKPMTIREISDITGISTSLVYIRLRNGYAIDGKFRKGKLAKRHTIDNRQLTAKDISNMFGMNLAKVYNIMKVCRTLHHKITLDMFTMF